MKNIKRIFPIVLIGVLTATTPVWAYHPSRTQMAQVAILAHQLEDAAHHVHVAAERNAHHRTRGEAYALVKLHQLDNHARHFHRQVERRLQSPSHTEADFRELVEKFYETQYAFASLHAFDHVRNDFGQVERLVNRLIDYYGGHAYWRQRADHRYHGG